MTNNNRKKMTSESDGKHLRRLKWNEKGKNELLLWAFKNLNWYFCYDSLLNLKTVLKVTLRISNLCRSRSVRRRSKGYFQSVTHLNFRLSQIVSLSNRVHAVVVELCQRITEKLETSDTFRSGNSWPICHDIYRFSCYHEVCEMLQL